jgi:competence protein ComFC
VSLSLLWAQSRGRVVDFLFPRWCLGCRQEGAFLCPSCLARLLQLLPPLCPRCGQPQALETCPFCREWRLSIDTIRSPYRFEGPVRQAVVLFKYDNLRALAPTLARLLKDYLDSHSLPFEAILPVPLHPRRQRQRGYNQAALLAQELGKLVGTPVVEGALRRVRATPPQARVQRREERRANVTRAFLCQERGLEGRNLLLVDDVCTTGATLDACAQALKKAGAKAVFGLTLAREV